MKITSLLLISVSTVVMTAMPNVLHATDTEKPKDNLAIQTGHGLSAKPLVEAQSPSSASVSSSASSGSTSSTTTPDKNSQSVSATVQASSSLWNLYGLLTSTPEDPEVIAQREAEKKKAAEKAAAEKKKADAKAAVDKVSGVTGLSRDVIKAILTAKFNPSENIGTSSPKVAAIEEGKIGNSYENFLDGLVAAFDSVVLDVTTVQEKTLASLKAQFVDNTPTIALKLLKGKNPDGLDVPLDAGEEAIGKALAALSDAVTKERSRVLKTSAKDATERNLTMLIDDVSFCVQYTYSAFDQLIERVNAMLARQNDITREKSGGKDAEAARLKAETDFKREAEALGSMLTLFKSTVRKPQRGVIGSIREVVGWSSTRENNVLLLNKALTPNVVDRVLRLMSTAKLQAVRTDEEQTGFVALLQNLRDSEFELKEGSEAEVKMSASGGSGSSALKPFESASAPSLLSTSLPSVISSNASSSASSTSTTVVSSSAPKPSESASAPSLSASSSSSTSISSVSGGGGESALKVKNDTSQSSNEQSAQSSAGDQKKNKNGTPGAK